MGQNQTPRPQFTPRLCVLNPMRENESKITSLVDEDILLTSQNHSSILCVFFAMLNMYLNTVCRHPSFPVIIKSEMDSPQIIIVV